MEEDERLGEESEEESEDSEEGEEVSTLLISVYKIYFPL